MNIVRHLDHDIWKKFVDESPQGNVFQTPEMYEVFSRVEGHDPTLWAALGDEGQILALFLPVQITVLDWPILRQLTSRSVVYGSGLCAPTPEGYDALDVLLQKYNRKIKNRILFTELRNVSDTSKLQPVLVKNGMAYEEHLNFLIDLTLPKSEIWNAIQSNAKRNVRKARKSGVEIETVEDQDGVMAAYKVLQKVYKRIQVPLPDQSLFKAAFEVLHPKGMFEIFLTRAEGIDIGALTLLLYKNVITYWYTGTLRKYSSYRPSDLLVWHALEWGIKNGFQTFDFGGGGKPNEEYGVRDFKAKFGGRLVSYGRNMGVHAPLRLRASQLGYKLLRGYL